MPRALKSRQQAVTVTVRPGDVRPESEDDPATNGAVPEGAERELEDAISESGDGSRPAPRTVVERATDDGEMAWCGRFPTHVVTREFLAKRCGAGRFRLADFVPRKQGGGYAPKGGVRWVEIDESAVPSDSGAELHDASESGNGGGNGASAMDLAVIGVVKQMGEAATTANQMLVQAFQAANARPGMSPVMEKLLAAALPVLVERLFPARDGGTKEQLEMIRAMAEILKPAPQQRASPLSETVDAIRAVRDLSSEFGGDGRDDRDETLPLLSKGLDVATEFLRNSRNGGNGANGGNDTGDHQPPPAGEQPPRIVARITPAVAPVPPVSEPAKRDLSAIRPWLKPLCEYVGDAPKWTWMSPDTMSGILWDRSSEDELADLFADVTSEPTSDFVPRSLSLLDPPSEAKGWVKEILEALAERVEDELEAAGAERSESRVVSPNEETS
jgi:hypothetical protein